MSKDQHNPEHLSSRLHQELGKAGWRIPQAEQEVRAAEEWVSKEPDRVPLGLQELPSEGSIQEKGRILDRYLRDDGRAPLVDDAKSKELDRPDHDLDRG